MIYMQNAPQEIKSSKSGSIGTVILSPLSFLKKIRGPKKVILLLAIAILLIGGVTAYYLVNAPRSHEGAAFSINGVNYSVDDYNQVLNSRRNKGIKTETVKNAYIELEKMKFAAHKVKVDIDGGALDNLSKTIFKKDKFNELSVVQQVSVYKPALNNKLNQTQAGDYQGYLYVFPFSNKIPQDSAEPIPGAGDQAAIDSDRQYALERTNHYYDLLKTGKISNDQALKEVLADKRLRYFNSSNDSVKFGPTAQLASSGAEKPSTVEDVINKNNNVSLTTTSQDTWKTFVRSHTMQDAISNLKKAGLSEVKKDQIHNTKTNAPEDAIYYFVDLKVAGKQNQRIRENYQHTLETLKVEIYV